MSWILFSILSSLILAAGNTADKYIVDKHINKLGALVLNYAIINLGFAFLVFLFSGFTLLPIKDILLILLTGVFLITSVILYYKALSLEEASRVIPLFQVAPVFALILGFIFLGEIIKLIAYPGFILILLGSILLSSKKIDGSILKPRPVFLLMMIVAFCSAAVSVIFKHIASSNNFWQTLGWQNLSISTAGLMLFLLPRFRREFLETLKEKGIKLVGLMSFSESLFFLGGMIKYYAITLAPVALVTVMGGAQPFFVFIYGILLSIFIPKIGKEEISKSVLLNKLIAIVLIFCGAYLVTF